MALLTQCNVLFDVDFDGRLSFDSFHRIRRIIRRTCMCVVNCFFVVRNQPSGIAARFCTASRADRFFDSSMSAWKSFDLVWYSIAI